MSNLPNLKTTIAVTNCNVDRFSRHDLLEWVNSTVNGKYLKVEELCSGTAYCQMMELLYPNCIGMKRVKVNAKLEHEYLYNLKLLQAAFTKQEFDKTVPIDRLVKARFQDNFEFLQWFKKFFDTFSVGKENLKVPAALAAAAANAPKPVRRPAIICTSSPPLRQMQKKQHLQDTPYPKSPFLGEPKKSQQRCVSPSSVEVLQEEIENMKLKIDIVSKEVNDYSKRICKIEKLLMKCIRDNEYVDLSQHALSILHSTKTNNSDAPCNMSVEY